MDKWRMVPGDSEAEAASRPRPPVPVSDEMTVEFEIAGVKLRATRVADPHESAIPGCEHWGLSVADIRASGGSITPEIAEASYELIRSFERGLTTTLAADLFKVRRVA